MTLHTTIEQRMKDDEQVLRGQLIASLESQQLTHRQELAEKEKLAKAMIDDVAAERVFLSTYQMKQDVYFAGIEVDRKTIDQAYQNVLPQLLNTKTFIAHIEKFLAGVDTATTLIAVGTHAQVLADAVRAAGHTAVEVKEGSGNGAVSYEQGSIRAEFSIDEFLADVKKMTISFVSEFIRNNG